MLELCTLMEVPNKFKLDYRVPILSQGSVGSCVSHAIAELLSYKFGEMYSVGYIHGNRASEDEYVHKNRSKETPKSLA